KSTARTVPKAVDSRTVVARAIPLFIYRIGRRLHRKLVVGMAVARVVCKDLVKPHRTAGWTRQRAGGARLAAVLHQLPDAQERIDFGRYVGRGGPTPAQPVSLLVRDFRAPVPPHFSSRV